MEDSCLGLREASESPVSVFLSCGEDRTGLSRDRLAVAMILGFGFSAKEGQGWSLRLPSIAILCVCDWRLCNIRGLEDSKEKIIPKAGLFQPRTNRMRLESPLQAVQNGRLRRDPSLPTAPAASPSSWPCWAAFHPRVRASWTRLEE